MSKNKIYLVAHSAGGLVARYYVQALGGSHYCEGLVTLATPHAGTWLAALGFFSPLILKARCLLQMLPVSKFVTYLNEDDWPAAFPLVSIFSPTDLMCPPKTTVIPDLLVNNESKFYNIEIGGISHGGFLMSKRCYANLIGALADILGAPVASPNQDSVSR